MTTATNRTLGLTSNVRDAAATAYVWPIDLPSASANKVLRYGSATTISPTPAAAGRTRLPRTPQPIAVTASPTPRDHDLYYSTPTSDAVPSLRSKRSTETQPLPANASHTGPSLCGLSGCETPLSPNTGAVSRRNIQPASTMKSNAGFVVNSSANPLVGATADLLGRSGAEFFRGAAILCPTASCRGNSVDNVDTRVDGVDTRVDCVDTPLPSSCRHRRIAPKALAGKPTPLSPETKVKYII